MRTNPLIVLALAPLLAACTASTTAWDAPTRVRFGTITPENARAVEQVFARHDLGVRKISTAPNAYDLYGLRTAQDFAELKHDLDNVFESQGIEVPLDFAMISYASTDPGSAQARATIDISAAPGARLFIADQTPRNPWREVVPTPSGNWRGTVQTNGLVAQNGGWVYVAARGANDFTRYFRISAGKGGLEPVSYVALRDTGLGEPLSAQANAQRTTYTSLPRQPMPKHLAQYRQQQQQYLRNQQIRQAKQSQGQYAAKPPKNLGALKHANQPAQAEAADSKDFR